MKTHGIKRLALSIAVTLLFCLAYFYIELPAINLRSGGFYAFLFLASLVFCAVSCLSLGLHRAGSRQEFFSALKAHCLIPVAVCAAALLTILIGTVIGLPVFRARAYSRLLELSDGDFASEVEEISFDQIPMLDEDSAMKLGDRKMGELAEYVSQFEVADNYTQINYNGRPVRVTPLEYGDIIKWLNNRSSGLPAYLIIDMVSQNVEVVRLDVGMKYSTAEHFSRNLYRHLRFNFPTFMFDEATFEIDEDGVPYWVCPRIVKRIGLFSGTDIEGAVLVNAVTGECKYYKDVPSWVDRVYTADLIIEQYDYHGIYQGGWLNSIFGQKNVTRTTEGYNYIAIGDDVYMYTGITSVMSDESNIGFILSNQRTKETKFYAVAGAEEYSARSSAEGVVQQYKYISTFPLLLNIYDQPTYFMALKDDAGLVKMYAMVNVQQYQIVATGASVSECEKNYVSLLAGSGLADQNIIDRSQVSGVIDDLRSAVLEGTTHVYIRFAGQTDYYVVSAADSQLAVILNIGDRITLTADPTGTDGIIQAYDVKLD